MLLNLSFSGKLEYFLSRYSDMPEFPGKLEYFLSRYSDMPEFPGDSASEIDACRS